MASGLHQMSSTKKAVLFASLGFVAVVVIFAIAAPSIQRSVFYPRAGKLPLVVTQTTAQLLLQLEAVLATNAPAVLRTLQPGLTEARIAELESEGNFKLPDDLRSLYRWRNGMTPNVLLGFMPGHRLLPLDEVVNEKTLGKPEKVSSSGLKQVAFSIFAGHRKEWLPVLDDGAGDGYFFDPNRAEIDGSFFYHMSEVGFYVWFPSVKNFLAGLVECYESGAIKMAADGSLEENYNKTELIWQKYGQSTE